MKHLTILSISAAAILFAGSQFKQSMGVYSDAKIIKHEITAVALKTKSSSDSLLVSQGSKATSNVAKKMENSAIQFAYSLIKSVFN